MWLGIAGRIVLKDGISYTVTSHSLDGLIGVWNPETNTLLFFDDLATFENWAYGKPIPCGAEREVLNAQK